MEGLGPGLSSAGILSNGGGGGGGVGGARGGGGGAGAGAGGAGAAVGAVDAAHAGMPLPFILPQHYELDQVCLCWYSYHADRTCVGGKVVRALLDECRVLAVLGSVALRVAVRRPTGVGAWRGVERSNS